MEQLLAAVDLGSNSFRLSIGRVVQHNGHAQIYTIDRLNESVRLAAGMGPDKYISPDAIERAVVILKRFNERLAGFSPQSRSRCGHQYLPGGTQFKRGSAGCRGSLWLSYRGHLRPRGSPPDFSRGSATSCPPPPIAV